MTNDPNENLPPAAVITLDRGAVKHTAEVVRGLQTWLEKERAAWRRFDEDDDRQQMQERDEEVILFSHRGFTAFRETLADLADMLEDLIAQTAKG